MNGATHDVIVIGGGLMGSSAAWHLSNQGKTVLLLEKQDINYDSGSSKGKTRIVRSSNIEDDELWSYLHDCAVKETELLINFLNSQGVVLTMEDIYTTSPVSYLAKLEELDRLLANLQKQNVNFEIATTPDQGKSKFGVNLQTGTLLQKEFKKYSGTLHPKRLIALLHKAVEEKGNEIRYNTKVERIEKNENLYSVSTIHAHGQTKILQASQLVCAVGPYTGPLLKRIASYFQELINPKRVFLTFLKINNYTSLSKEQKQQLKNGYPVIDRAINYESEEFYAMIENYDPDGTPIIKIGGHFQRSDIKNLEQIWKVELSPKEISWAIRKTSNYLNLLDIPINTNQINVVDTYSCVYSLTKSEVPFVTPIIDLNGTKDKNLVVMAGMSGVGAKGAMTYGLIAANLLTDETQSDSFYNRAVERLGYERLVKEVRG